MTFFTDWTRTDPHYFYIQGVVFGCVFFCMLQNVILPFIKKLFKK